MSISPGGTADSADERGDAPAVLAALGVNRSAVVRSLYAACLLLTIVGGVAEWLWDDGGWKYRFVQLNGEANLPTWYSASQLILAAVLGVGLRLVGAAARGCREAGRGASSRRRWCSCRGSTRSVRSTRADTYADRWLATGGPDWWRGPSRTAPPACSARCLLRSWWRSLPTSTRRSFLVGRRGVRLRRNRTGARRGSVRLDRGATNVTMTVVEEAFEMFAVAYVIGALLAHIDGVSRLTIGGVPRADIA